MGDSSGKECQALCTSEYASLIATVKKWDLIKPNAQLLLARIAVNNTATKNAVTNLH